MSKEKVDYRDNLEMLQAMFPGKMTISIQEACSLLNREKRSLLGDRSFPAQKVGGRYAVPIVGLARYLS